MTTSSHQEDRSSAPAPQDWRLHSAWEALRRPDIRVVSTDIFDTLLWRQVAEPSDAFALLGERLARRGQLASKLSPQAFQSLRRSAEEEARRHRALVHNDLEVTLEEIYAGLPDWLFNHSPAGRAAALDAELALEREIIVPDLDVVALLVAAARADKRVVAVSDTYFSEAQLRGLLDQPGLEELSLDRVFSSSEHRRSKADGLLGVMAAEVDVAAEVIVHLGDNWDADIKPAAELGMTAVAFERHPSALVELLRQERRFAQPRSQGVPAPARAPELTSLRGKVAARAEGGAVVPALQPFWQTGSLVLGPVFTGFAEWVQERAAEHHLDRLFCFMREGEFLTTLVDRAGQAMDLPARCERLWLNREVLLAASIGNASPGELAQLLARRRTPTVAQLLRTAGLSMADLPGFASHGDTSLEDPVVRENVFRALESDAALTARMVLHGRQQRERVIAYVDSLLEGRTRMGVVDLGWGGTAQRLLQQILRAAGREVEIIGLYLVTHERVNQEVVSVRGMTFRGFLGEMGEPRDSVRAITRNPEILEQLCMPDHGPQVGLDEQLRPVLAPASHDRLQMVEARALRQGTEAFQREWARYRVLAPGKIPALSDFPELLRPLLQRLLLAPTPAEATLLGSWLHDENQGSGAAEEIADMRHVARLRYLSPDQLRLVPMEDLYWPAGLAARADPDAAALFAAASAGELPWESVGSPLESGPCRIEAEGTDVDPASPIETTPQRNRLGLSEVFGTIRAPAIRTLVVRPCEKPAVVRCDYLEVRCHAQGERDPLVLELSEPRDFARLQLRECHALTPNVFVAQSHNPVLRLDLAAVTPRTIFRVDVRFGFAILPTSQLLPTAGARPLGAPGARADAVGRQLEPARRILRRVIGKLLRELRRLAQ